MNAPGGELHAGESAHLPPDRHRQRRAPWLWLLVLLQLAIPASYYVRGEREDERFAWRMFSAVRVQKCRVRASAIDVDGARTPIDLDAALHSAWVRALERGRTRVIERFLREQCEKSAAQRVDLRRTCSDAAGREAGRDRFSRDCQAGTLAREALP